MFLLSFLLIISNINDRLKYIKCIWFEQSRPRLIYKCIINISAKYTIILDLVCKELIKCSKYSKYPKKSQWSFVLAKLEPKSLILNITNIVWIYNYSNCFAEIYVHFQIERSYSFPIWLHFVFECFCYFNAVNFTREIIVIYFQNLIQWC